MNRRQMMSTVASIGLASPALARLGQQNNRGTKKGWCGSDIASHKLFDAKWYYNWTPGWQANQGIEFVPMVKKGSDVKKLGLIERNADAKFMLGFNEPERKKQGNLSVGQPIAFWPELQKIALAKGIPLGSPAPSSDRAGMEWLAEFMKRAKNADLQIDFIALHWYRSRDPDAFEDWIKGFAREYKRPIWITEFNGWAGTEKENYNFLKKALKFLERSDDVQRYAYFNPKAGKPTSLVNLDGTPTRLGELYQEAGS